MMMILEAPVPSLRSIVSTVPPELDGIVLRGLSRNPSDRFASAQEMQVALARCVEGASVRDVGAWVRSLASEALAARAQIAEQVDAVTSETLTGMHEDTTQLRTQTSVLIPVEAGASGLTDASVVVPRSAREAQRRKGNKAFSRPIVAGVFAAIGLAILGGTWLSRTRSPVQPVEPVAESPHVAAREAPTSSGRPTEAAATSDPPPASATPVEKPVATPARAFQRPPVTKSPSAPAIPAKTPAGRAGRCDPPYSIDSAGFRTPKPECL